MLVRTLGVVIAAACAVTACGGSGDSDRTTQTSDPAAPPAEEADDSTSGAGPGSEAAQAGAGDAPGSSSEPAPDADIPDRLLAAHNEYREKHCASPLTWSDELAEVASAWAEELRDRGCPLAHSDHESGENLAAGSIGALDAERVVKLWYEEVELYDFADPGFEFETGHFTQLVWTGTRELGCARSSCPDIDLWVCNYAPAGNTLGEFEASVLPLSCDE